MGQTNFVRFDCLFYSRNEKNISCNAIRKRIVGFVGLWNMIRRKADFSKTNKICLLCYLPCDGPSPMKLNGTYDFFHFCIQICPLMTNCRYVDVGLRNRKLVETSLARNANDTYHFSCVSLLQKEFSKWGPISSHESLGTRNDALKEQLAAKESTSYIFILAKYSKIPHFVQLMFRWIWIFQKDLNVSICIVYIGSGVA